MTIHSEPAELLDEDASLGPLLRLTDHVADALQLMGVDSRCTKLTRRVCQELALLAEAGDLGNCGTR